MKPEHALRLIDETQSLTRHYASYQRQKGGLGYTLGGLVLLTASLLALFLKPGPISTLSMCGFTLLWLIGKAVLSNCLYTPLGRVKERWSPSRNRLHVFPHTTTTHTRPSPTDLSRLFPAHSGMYHLVLPAPSRRVVIWPLASLDLRLHSYRQHQYPSMAVIAVLHCGTGLYRAGGS